MAIEDVVRQFEESMSTWDITLPPDSVAARELGGIVNNGWTIFYKFGFEGDDEYMDVYASHRMTNDRHMRLYADGRSRVLPAYREGYVVGKTATAEEEERIKREFYAYNKVVAELLAEKGFTSSDAHASHNLRQWMVTNPAEERGELESSD